MGFLEIPSIQNESAVDDRDAVLPDWHVIAELAEEVGHVTVDRRPDLSALEVDPRLVQVRLRLLELGLGG